MKSLVMTLVLLAFVPAWSNAEGYKGLVEVNGRKLYVDYTAPVEKKPTVVLVNGLTYSTRNWGPVARYFRGAGYGLLMFDMYGMGTTLLSNPLPTRPILYKQQAADIRALLTTLRIRGPYNLVGLSYGGGIIASFATQFPRDVANMVLFAPYTEFLEFQKNWLKTQIDVTRKMFPQNPATDEELTDFFIRQLVYTTYPLAEISSVENPYKLEGITRLVQGIRMYQPIEETRNIPARALHLVVAENDQYIPRDVFNRYWQAVPKRARASRTLVRYSEHKMPEAFPRFTYQFIKGVVDGQPLLFNGDTLAADPLTMQIKKAE
ncbi:MAG: alpha/beta fold hydrolase [Bdellovibrionales bacterium]